MTHIKQLIILAENSLRDLEKNKSSFDISKFDLDIQNLIIEDFNKNKNAIVQFISILNEHSDKETFTKEMCDKISFDDYLFISEQISAQVDLELKQNNKFAMIVASSNHPKANDFNLQIFNAYWPVSDAKSDFVEAYNKYRLK